MEEHWSSANLFMNLPRWKKVDCMQSEMHNAHTAFVLYEEEGNIYMYNTWYMPNNNVHQSPPMTI